MRVSNEYFYAPIQKIFEKGSNFCFPNTTKIGPSLAHQQNAFCLRADDGPTLNAGLVAL